MLIVRHRVNSLEELIQVPSKYGVEIDLRTKNNNIILNHDPFKSGELFSDWIKEYKHKLLILNVKEDGLEEKVIKTLDDYKISNYLFLDQPIPSQVKYFRSKSYKSLVRYSEYEKLTMLKMNEGKKFIWVDSFHSLSFSDEFLNIYNKDQLNIVIVSPELQGRKKEEIIKMQDVIKRNEIKVYAVCTKYPHLWSDSL